MENLFGLEGFEQDLAHIRWNAFFDGWDEDKRAFYSQMLGESNALCRCGNFGSRHFLGVDGDCCLREMCARRRSEIFAKIRQKMETAIRTVDSHSFLFNADGWGFLGWVVPPFLQQYIREDEKPKLMVFSMEQRKVMIVNVTVRWEGGLANPNPEPYQRTVQSLRGNNFVVQIRNIEIGCRGVYCQQLYDLFCDDFQMGDEEIEVTMMDISKGILSCAYEFYRPRLNQN